MRQRIAEQTASTQDGKTTQHASGRPISSEPSSTKRTLHRPELKTQRVVYINFPAVIGHSWAAWSAQLDVRHMSFASFIRKHCPLGQLQRRAY